VLAPGTGRAPIGRRQALNYNERMLALRFAGLLALAVWVGGLTALGVSAAPAIFDVVGLRQVADGRVLAGAIFAEILRRFHLIAYACGAVLILSLIARAVLGPRPRQFGVRLAVAAVMLTATLYSGLIVSGRIERQREAIGAAPSSLDADDPRRAAFERLHELSMALQLVPFAGGLILLLWEVRN
jgi:Domain of unknown function (DUF4149)